MESNNDETMNNMGPGDQEIIINNPDPIPNYDRFPDIDVNSPIINYENISNVNESLNHIQVSPWGSDFNSCHTIENLNMTSNFELNKDIQEIIDIHQDMVLLLSERFITDLDKEKDEDLLKHKKTIEEGMDSFKLLTKEFQAQQNKTLLAEKEFKLMLEETSKDTDKIKDFTTFMIQLNSKYDDPEIDSLNKTMVKISEKIKNNSKCKELKEEYQKQNYLMKYYLHHFIKGINGGNLGSTCNLCLQRQVDTFMDPCGHTGCSDCILKLKNNGSEYNTNCFICRRHVNRFQKLFFT